MKKPKNMPKDTWELVSRNFDKIYETDRCPTTPYFKGYWEVRGSFCGDMRCMRFYDDGMVGER